MKKNLLALLVISALAVASALVATAADKEKTIVGDGACAKCVLKETETCQHTVTTDEGGKKVTYYLAQNDVAKEFGNQLCTEKKKIKVTGTVKTVGGKQELTATKMELGTN